MTETLLLRGAFGSPYLFYVYPWDYPFRPVGAVYAVLGKSLTGYQVNYIGQTGDLSHRFDDHHKRSCFDRTGVTHIAIHPIPQESRRLLIESDLVRSYRPVCNG